MHVLLTAIRFPLHLQFNQEGCYCPAHTQHVQLQRWHSKAAVATLLLGLRDFPELLQELAVTL